ncbi:MAG: hypothetical protein RBT64_10440 [Trichloromonas sp.]|jgi:hypothetical protein|nr:hypothetical protein [Trichloromonas sp.]
MKKLTGTEAIKYAEVNGLTLSKHTDPTEEARTGLTAEEAREIAKEDPSLIHLELRLIGWKKGNDQIDAPAGYQDEYYWQGGKYQGPDEDGIEPVYEVVG